MAAKVKNPEAVRIGKRSRAKGQTFERLVAKHLQAVFPEAKRGIGQARSAKEVSDIEGTPWWLELKHRKGVDVPGAMRQAEGDTDGRPCAVIWRENAERIIHVTLRLSVLLHVATGSIVQSKTSDILIDMRLEDFLALLADK